MRKALLIAVAVLVVFVAGFALFIGSGTYNVAADEPHSTFVYRLLEATRERSIAAHAEDIEVPELEDPARVRRGAGNYDAMCKGCHLAPGMAESELSVGLYPAPPNLAKHARTDSAAAFWIIKHGIKTTGMPAWGKSMEDMYIWDMVAFLHKLPALSPEQYQAEVAASGGHSHGGGEPGRNDAAADHDALAADRHVHADGKQHIHESPDHTPVAVVKALHRALSSGNAGKVKELLDPQVLIFEGAKVERSLEEYAAHHLSSDLEFMKSVDYQLERQSGTTAGDLAWVGSEGRLTGNREGEAIEIVSTETLVLKKSQTGWKVVHIHWSNRNAKE